MYESCHRPFLQRIKEKFCGSEKMKYLKIGGESIPCFRKIVKENRSWKRCSCDIRAVQLEN